MEWAVGKQGEIMRPDSGKLMLPGSKIHLGHPLLQRRRGRHRASSKSASTSTRKARSRSIRQQLALWGAGGIDIAPGEVKVTEGFHTMPRAGRVESFQPHMHLRGKAMMMEAISRTARRQVLSYVNDFNFNWHNSYVYADDVAPLLPKGTIISVTAWHDNTAAKKSNPDPTQWVGYGDRTVDEMAHAWVNVTT